MPTYTSCSVRFLRSLCYPWVQEGDSHKSEELGETLPLLVVTTAVMLGGILDIPMKLSWVRGGSVSYLGDPRDQHWAPHKVNV